MPQVWENEQVNWVSSVDFISLFAITFALSSETIWEMHVKLEMRMDEETRNNEKIRAKHKLLCMRRTRKYDEFQVTTWILILWRMEKAKELFLCRTSKRTCFSSYHITFWKRFSKCLGLSVNTLNENLLVETLMCHWQAMNFGLVTNKNSFCWNVQPLI